MKCGYAAPGTYGHECGRPAVIAAVMDSNLKPGMDEFVSGRCGECRSATGRDNWGVRFEPLEPGRDKPYWRKKGMVDRLANARAMSSAGVIGVPW